MVIWNINWILYYHITTAVAIAIDFLIKKYIWSGGSVSEEKIYGGCEGPEAMYVKLVSSDGHEFIVKREHALTSGTIKAMLSGPGQFAENEANEVNFREIP